MSLETHLKGNINFGSEYINVKTSTNVHLQEEFVVVTTDGPISLKVNINADLIDIPNEYHEVFLNVLTAKYLNKVSFGTNPFSECKPVFKRRWFQFWKSKYFTQYK